MYTFNFPERITDFISKVDDFGNTYPIAKSPSYFLKLHGNPSYFFRGSQDGKNMQLSNMEYIYSFTFEHRKYELLKEELSKKCG